MGEALSVSPDGNWIVFSLFDIGDQDGVYLGNLRNGTSQLIYKPELNEVTGALEPAPTSYEGWSPDSTQFVFGGSYKTFLGNIQGEVTPLGGMNILGWVDNSHYFGGSILGEVGSQETVKIIELHPDLDRSESPIAFVFLGH
jgi:Tol biopolymer transport system component